jgi:hypothetical protein
MSIIDPIVIYNMFFSLHYEESIFQVWIEVLKIRFGSIFHYYLRIQTSPLWPLLQ